MSGIVERLRFIGELVAQPALVSGGLSLGYAELAERVTVLAAWLKTLDAGVVGLHSQNSVSWVIADLACQQAGVVCVPLPAFFSVEQCRHCISQAGVSLLISDQPDLFDTELFDTTALSPSPFLPQLYLWRVATQDTAVLPRGTQKITFTSGSTGKPKGVCLSFAHQWQVAESLADSINLNSPRHLCLLPLSTLLENIAGVYSPLLCGGTVYLADDASRGLGGSSRLNLPVLLDCIQQVRPQTLILLPQLLTALLAACQQGWRAPASLKFVAVGGARVAVQAIHTARAYGIPLYQGYGLSECGSVVALNTPGRDRIDCVGAVLPHCQVMVEDDEVVVTGACHLGYLGCPESWYPDKVSTGDIGALTDNWLSIEGRRDNLLITGFGRNISPEWLEAEVLASPLLSQCLVVGDGRPFLGALLGTTDGVSDSAITQWLDTVNRRLPDYAQLLRWQRIDAPAWGGVVTANGRLQRGKAHRVFAKQIEALYLQQPQDYQHAVL